MSVRQDGVLRDEAVERGASGRVGRVRKRAEAGWGRGYEWSGMEL